MVDDVRSIDFNVVSEEFVFGEVMYIYDWFLKFFMMFRNLLYILGWL